MNDLDNTTAISRQEDKRKPQIPNANMLSPTIELFAKMVFTFIFTILFALVALSVELEYVKIEGLKEQISHFIIERTSVLMIFIQAIILVFMGGIAYILTDSKMWRSYILEEILRLYYTMSAVAGGVILVGSARTLYNHGDDFATWTLFANPIVIALSMLLLGFGIPLLCVHYKMLELNKGLQPE